MKRLLIPCFLAGATALCLALAMSPAEADRKHYVKLGNDWRRLSASLDDVYEAMQKDAGITPAPMADDDIFLRRIYIDLTGAPPSPDEIKAFSPGKHPVGDRRNIQAREALIEQLLASEAYADHMAQWWTVAFGERKTSIRGRMMSQQLEHYLRQAIGRNAGWDEVIRGLMGTAPYVGNNSSPIWPQLLMQQQDLAFVSGTIPRVVLGRQIECAECHDHPYDPWTQDDFEAWNAFFVTFIESTKRDDEVFLSLKMDMHFRTEREAAKALQLKGRHKLPRYLDGTMWKPGSGKTLREDMTSWMVSKDNAWFREMTVNRVMAYFMGVGFVNPVDDFNTLNEPTIPVILRVLAEDFAASGFDMRYLTRAIVNSRMYQRETGANITNLDDRVLFSRQFVREFSPEMVERTIMKVLQVETLNRAPAGRALPVRNAAADTNDRTVQFYRYRLNQMITNAWEEEPPHKDVDDRGGNITRALMFMNGDILPRGLNTSLAEILKKHRKPVDRAEAIFTTVLGRRPKPHELTLMEETIAQWATRKKPEAEVYEDLFLALMATPEFLNRT